MPANEVTPTRFLIESVSGRVRKLLVLERDRATRGNFEGVLRSLEVSSLSLGGGPVYDRVAVGMLRAELLDADFRGDEAVEVFDREVTPLAESLPQSHRFAVEQNRLDLSSQFWKSTAEFYHLADRKRLSGFEWLDYADLFGARQSADAGKHYETLPVLWQQLRRSYLSGCWFARRVTAKLFSAECAALGEWDLAAHHLLGCRDDDLAKTLAEGVVAADRVEIVRQVVDRVVGTANLKEHFAAGCQLLAAMADVIPDADVPRVADWLYPHAAATRTNSVGANPVESAWTVAGRIGHRLPAVQARRWIAMATRHPVWTTRLNDPSRVIAERETFIGAVLPIASVLKRSPREVESLARSTLPLLADCSHAQEYGGVLNVLCNIAEWGGSELRATLAKTLYPPGQPLTSHLVLVAHHFDKSDRFTAENLAQYAEAVAGQIRLQVQRVEAVEAPTPPHETIMHSCRPTTGGELHAYLTEHIGLAALARHRAKLPEKSLALLVRAALDLARDRDNVLTNRAGLLQLLREFGDAVMRPLRLEVVAGLEPLARGPVAESELGSKAADAKDPLNRFKMNFGTPERVQAAATAALAAFAYPDPKARPALWPILGGQMYDERAEIRRGAYQAAGECETLDGDTLAGLLGGLRDPDPAVAATAFGAMATRPGWKLDKNQWRAFAFAAGVASRSRATRLRRHAALAAQSRANDVPVAMRPEFSALMARFRGDIAASVRDCLGSPVER